MSKARRHRSLVVVTPIPTPSQEPMLRGRAIPWTVLLPVLVFAMVGIVDLVGRALAARSRQDDEATVAALRLEAGDLVAVTGLVPIPESMVPRQAWGGSQRWRLPGYSRPQAEALLAGLRGVEEALQCDAIGCFVEPDLDAVAALSPVARSRIYSVLTRIPGNPQTENTFYRLAERGPFSMVPGVPPEVRPLLDLLTWTRSGVPAFSDIRVVCARLGSPEACQGFIRAMLSRPNATVDLRIAAPGSIDRIASSFGPRDRVSVRERLGAARRAGAESIPLASLLPSWARERLGTFPEPEEAWTNCFWTSLRFVDEASDVVSTGEMLDERLHRDFERVTTAAQFGDILVLRERGRGVVHTATWLLGGYVFEKNGAGRLQAWRIVPLAEATADYPEVDATELWRLRERH